VSPRFAFDTDGVAVILRDSLNGVIAFTATPPPTGMSSPARSLRMSVTSAPLTTPSPFTSAFASLKPGIASPAMLRRKSVTSAPLKTPSPFASPRSTPEDGLTVTSAVPETVSCPTAAAVIVAVPALTGVTTPVAETVATATSLDDHTTSWSASAGATVAVNEPVLPPTVKASVAGATVTPVGKVTVSRTVISAVPKTVSNPTAVAVIVAVPPLTGTTTPAETVATASLLDDHVTAWLAPAGATVAVNEPVLPPTVKVSLAGAIVTLVGSGSPPPLAGRTSIPVIIVVITAVRAAVLASNLKPSLSRAAIPRTV